MGGSMNLESFLKVLREFGALISAGFLLTAGAVLYRVFRATIRQKEAQIDVLRERVEAAEALSFKCVGDQINGAERIREWLQNSVDSARELEFLSTRDQKAHMWRIERELAERRRIAEEHEARGDESFAEHTPQVAEAFCGTYSIIGRVCEGSTESYEGILDIQSKGEGVVTARWVIGPTKTEHLGHGVFSGGRLAIAYRFKMAGHRDTGVVLYELVGPEVLRGVWGQPSSTYLGIEECRRLTPDELDDLDLVSLRRRGKFRR